MAKDCPRKEMLREAGKEKERDTLWCSSIHAILPLERGKRKRVSKLSHHADLTLDVLVDGMGVSALIDTSSILSVVSREKVIT